MGGLEGALLLLCRGDLTGYDSTFLTVVVWVLSWIPLGVGAEAG